MKQLYEVKIDHNDWDDGDGVNCLLQLDANEKETIVTQLNDLENKGKIEFWELDVVLFSSVEEYRACLENWLERSNK